MNTDKILRPIVKEVQSGLTKKITPSQFIMTAAPQQPDKGDKAESQGRRLNLFTNPVATSTLPNGTLRR